MILLQITLLPVLFVIGVVLKISGSYANDVIPILVSVEVDRKIVIKQ